MMNYLDLFKAYLYNEKKSSVNTVESYNRDISQFASYCASNNMPDLAKVDNEFLLSYLDSLAKLRKSEATISRIIASLRCFYRFLGSRGFCENNPLNGVKVKKAERKLPDVLDSNEILLLLAQPNGSDYKSIRDKAMLELLYATGIKVSELIDLSVNDINLQVGIVHLKNNKKDRIIPLYPAAIKSISEYLINVRPVVVLDENEDKLFTNMTGQHMSRQGFWKIVKHYANSAGIKKDITPHTLRHSFAAHLLENGAKLTDIKEMLGHADLSSTQIYAQLMKSKYTAAYTKFHPLAR